MVNIVMLVVRKHTVNLG